MASVIAPTDKRAVVRVLLRESPPIGGEGTTRMLAGYMVIILGPVKPGEWPGIAVEPDDIEGMAWTTPRQLHAVVKNLLACPTVVHARGASR